MWKRLCDIGWSDEKECKGCDKEEGTERHRLYHCPSCREVRNHIPDGLGKWEQKAKTSKGRLEAARRNKVALSEWMLLEEKAT